MRWPSGTRARGALLPHLDGVRRFATSSLFYAFCRRNPKLFRLWGSVLADVAFFFDDLSAPHREFLRSFPLEEMIEGEPADFRLQPLRGGSRRAGRAGPGPAAGRRRDPATACVP